MSTSDPDRKTQLADAAIAVVGHDGLRALTHRAVDARAGLPPGTCSYHYPSRRALLGAVLRRIAVLDALDIEAIAVAAQAAHLDRQHPEALVSLATGLLAGWLGPARTRLRARFVLMLDPQARQEAGPIADSLTERFITIGIEMFGGPERARLLVALCDGLLADELMRGTEPVDVSALQARVAATVTGWRSLAT